MAKLRTLGPLVRTLDTRTVALPAKQADPFYASPEYLRWRERVIARAGGQCEAKDNGRRCSKGYPNDRLFAHHIKELSDGGAPLDVANGMALCGAHHTAVTAENRAARR